MDVGGDVYAYGVVHGFDYVHAEAVFQPAELLELFDAFQFAGREGGKFEEGVAAIAIEADVFPVLGGYAVACVAHPGDGGTGKIERLAVEIQDDFDDVGIHDFAGESDGRARGGELDGVVIGHGGGYGVNRARVYEGLVALHVDIDVCRDVSGDFGDAVSPSTVIGASQDGFAAEGFDGGLDAVVFGGDDDARREAGQTDVLNDVLNHGLASDRRERLTGKARGGVARGDYYQDRGFAGIRHGSCSPFASAGILTFLVETTALNSARLERPTSYIEVTRGACFGHGE